MIGASKVIFAALDGEISDLTVAPRAKANNLPIAIYSVEATEPTRTQSGVFARNYICTVTIYASSYSQSQTIAGQVVDLLEAIGRTTVAGEKVRYCTATFTGDLFDEEIGFGADISINLTIEE